MKTLRKIRQIIQNLIDDIPPEAKKMLPMAGILLLAIVLTIIIVIAQSCGRREDTVPETTEFVFEDIDIVEETISPLSESDGSGTDEEGQEESESEEDYGNLKKDSDPELLAVMRRYFNARANGDLDTINELYGITEEDEEEYEENLEVLQFNARYISSFDNLTTYVMDGPYDDCWLVYATTDISFYTCSTKAPTIMWCFIEKSDDDEYHIVDSHSLTAELTEYAEEENHTPEVRALAADVNDRLREALESDPELEETYGILRSGSPLWANTSEAETEVAIVEEEPQRTAAYDEDTSDEDTSGDDTSEEDVSAEDTSAQDTSVGETIEALDIGGAGGTDGTAQIAGPAGDLTPIEAGTEAATAADLTPAGADAAPAADLTPIEAEP